MLVCCVAIIGICSILFFFLMIGVYVSPCREGVFSISVDRFLFLVVVVCASIVSVSIYMAVHVFWWFGLVCMECSRPWLCRWLGSCIRQGRWCDSLPSRFRHIEKRLNGLVSPCPSRSFGENYVISCVAAFVSTVAILSFMEVPFKRFHYVLK